MAGVFHLSEMLSLALHSMVYIATSDDEYINVKQIAASTGASEAHLSKVLQRLSKGRIIHSVRGPRGGFALALPPEEISFLDIYEIIEGPAVIEGCPNHRKACPFNNCIFKGIPEKMNRQFLDYLKQHRLSDFIDSRKKISPDHQVV
ncbi:Rrf2 family protein [Tindallia magadiensis]|uniref:Rrf2 family protein n=1 Tax=Tindallia magadiensis TaxID=69895 RepID=A0A1I3BE29_9FIRM|nr:Rrf2 family transcriptional regulator [Tindallia magadiensis]SFH60565.1 Rrf2 family protein [Tindallia magadiensis]